ncbi:TetR/AcrR family transcriptional regulator [Oceanobacillus sp. M65]|uniref:TetR/AcrR family transcriptional regulator n=1 Tax=Oceanobacillus sp. M65 TaxID=3457435 RepID=UPI003FCC896A
MNEKKMKLIETGMRLFAQKGYYNTSIQEIASESGISKGAFYIHFKSKEDFISTSFEYFHHNLSVKMNEVKAENDDPRESLANQITVLFDFLYKSKDSIMMLIRENISIGENTDKLMEHFKVENFNWLKENITAIYGETAKPFLIDLIIQLGGLLDGYFKWIVLDHVSIERKEAGAFIVRRLDDLMEGMVHRQETALVTVKQIPKKYNQDDNKENMPSVEEIFATLRGKLSDLSVSEEELGRLGEAIKALEIEFQKKESQAVVIQGLLAHFNHHPTLKKESYMLSKIAGIKLLQ